MLRWVKVAHCDNDDELRCAASHVHYCVQQPVRLPYKEVYNAQIEPYILLRAHLCVHASVCACVRACMHVCVTMYMRALPESSTCTEAERVGHGLHEEIHYGQHLEIHCTLNSPPQNMYKSHASSSH